MEGDAASWVSWKVRRDHLTPKSDVYSYGVVLLELLSGRRLLDEEKAGCVEEVLADWVKPFLSDNGGFFRIMDTRLGGQYSKKGAQAAASLALQCLDAGPKNRPTMSYIVSALEQLQTSSKDVRKTPREGKREDYEEILKLSENKFTTDVW
ncbi:probable serine/threonine-protein kinase PBL18 [Diospyros lotus]|uniref:probable serine/threonine-protein kinase PBL18 n=1 Tax=Diospyros lotus TaxID=55363 RepID=UPI002257CAC3|nr:probable serine/threonine-protein kinase PBL18 [Diospyros lotus]